MKACWAGYFEQLYQADPPAVKLDVKSVKIPVADPPINCGPPSFVETQAAVNQLKGGKAPAICGIMLNFLRLVEMLYSCRCMQLCALFRAQGSFQLTVRGASLSPSGK